MQDIGTLMIDNTEGIQITFHVLPSSSEYNMP
jgi:hypothetical protein